MGKDELLERFRAFMGAVGKDEKVAVVHHRDTDGLCAALVFSKALEKLRGRPADFELSAEYADFGEVVAALKGLNPAKIAVLDLSIDQNKENVLALEGIAPLLLLDHHKLYNDMNSERTVFIKSGMVSEMDGSRYPASKLAFDLCSGLVDLREEKWIACLGVLGDMGYNHWKPFFEEAFRENSVSLNDLNYLKELINAVETVKPEKFSELFVEFHLKSPKQLLESGLNKYKKKLKAELSKWRADFKKNAEFRPEAELYFYVFKPAIELKSALIDELTVEYPGKTLVVAIDMGGESLRFSARRQDFKVKMNDLLEQAVKEIPGAEAGGHIPAAAGSVPREKLDVFKENVIRILREKPKK